MAHAARSLAPAIAERFALAVDLPSPSYEAFLTYRPNPNAKLSRMLEGSEVPYDRRAAYLPKLVD